MAERRVSGRAGERASGRIRGGREGGGGVLHACVLKLTSQLSTKAIIAQLELLAFACGSAPSKHSKSVFRLTSIMNSALRRMKKRMKLSKDMVLVDTHALKQLTRIPESRPKIINEFAQ